MVNFKIVYAIVFFQIVIVGAVVLITALIIHRNSIKKEIESHFQKAKDYQNRADVYYKKLNTERMRIRNQKV